MQRVDGTDLWKAIPPEEKFEIMARAQGSGLISTTIVVIAGCTFAAGLHIPALIWGSLIISPLVFQFTAGRAWRALRPAVMLEYLAARSVARRYAFAAKSKELTPNLIFKAHFEEILDRADIQASLEAAIENNSRAEVWVALFQDVVVCMAEAPGGAELRFAQLLNDKIEVDATSSDNRDYSNSKEVVMSVRVETGDTRRFKVTSDYPAALIVFEKRMRQSIIEMQARADKIAAPVPASDDPFGD